MSFPRSWSARRLEAAPLIAPARHFMYPQAIPGEEDALARGALRLEVRPRVGGTYLVECALGFREPTLPSGVWSTPEPDWLCAVAGGYAYLADTTAPASVTLLPMRPVAQVLEAVDTGLLLFAGFHTVLAWGAGAVRWETERVSWEGITEARVEGDEMVGLGWDLITDREIQFSVELATGRVRGGVFQPV